MSDGPDIRYHRACAWMLCEEPRHPGRGVPLCNRHALTVYAIIAAEHADGQVPLPAEPEPRPEPKSGTIYYLRVGDNIKIGYASNLWRRMRSYPPNAEVLATEPAGREWFRPDPLLMAHIAEVAAQTYIAPGEYDRWSYRSDRVTPARPKPRAGFVR